MLLNDCSKYNLQNYSATKKRLKVGIYYTLYEKKLITNEELKKLVELNE